MNYEAGHLNWVSRRSRAIHARMPDSSETLCEKPIKRWLPVEEEAFTCRKCRAFAFPLERIKPAPDYLAYSPKNGRYSLCVVWGHGFGTKVQCRFYIMDFITGEEVQLFSYKLETEAVALRPELVRQVQRMNRKAKLAA